MCTIAWDRSISMTLFNCHLKEMLKRQNRKREKEKFYQNFVNRFHRDRPPPPDLYDWLAFGSIMMRFKMDFDSSPQSTEAQKMSIDPTL